MTQEFHDPHSSNVIGAAIEVHRQLGPGLLESAYAQCLGIELEERGLSFEREVFLPVMYRGRSVDCAYRLDIVVDSSLILEIKAVDHLMPVHTAQLITYLKLSNLRVGLLLNFNVSMMKLGIRRLVL